MKFYKIVALCYLIIVSSCNSPINDNKIEVEIKQFNFPVLKNKKDNPVLRICLNNHSFEKH